MAVFSGMFPVVPGREDAARAWLQEVAGPRADGFDALQQRSGITRETVTIQATPMGAFMLVWFEGDDVERAFAEVATGEDEFTTWHRARLEEVTGIDLSQPGEGPPPETIVD
jgi:hypothetical protein